MLKCFLHDWAVMGHGCPGQGFEYACSRNAQSLIVQDDDSGQWCDFGDFGDFDDFGDCGVTKNCHILS